MSETVIVVRNWLIAGVIVALAITGCTAADSYQRRSFKETAIKAGMSATEVDCAWDSTAGSSGTKANCAILSTRK